MANLRQVQSTISLSWYRLLPDDCLSLTLVRPCPPSASQAHPGGKVPT